jgi:propionyl-CoA carboxylase alpha chain
LFNKILIANRGEIACRIIKTCKHLGIKTVGVYSESDAQAMHVDMADEAYLIGPSPALDSYLKVQTLIDTALKCGAEAVHPGYGFLSENADFAEAVNAAGMTFIGPSPKVIRLMGDKLQAKVIARKAGVPLVPGSEEPVTTVGDVKKYALKLGYPLLLKAAAGGGGKGMRVVRKEEEIHEFLQMTANEASSSFGDSRIFVEQYIESPRHIEIQILADQHGQIIHLGERDCSLQRRHQKIIEEAPSPFLTPQLRKEMATQAVALAKQVGYTSVGTVEFMVTTDHQFYFLEMNTRLQVEHPVTEMVTGLDIVEQMIRVAANEPLSLKQEQMTITGHAIEARIYAEDASQGFIPSSGRVTYFDPPPLNNELRLDTGIEAGSEVSIYYDPMIGKLIAWAPDRPMAVDKLRRGLAQFILEGPLHNIGFLEYILYQPRIIEGQFTTHFIEQEMTSGLTPSQSDLVAGIAGVMYNRKEHHGVSTEWIVAKGEEGTIVKVEGPNVWVNQKEINFELDWRPVERRFSISWNNQTYYGLVYWQYMSLSLQLFGIQTKLQVMRPKMWDLMTHVHPPVVSTDSLTIKAPMPGIVVDLPIHVGEQVKTGQPLAIIEAMKMENILKSPTNGTVKEIFAKKGDSLVRDQLLVILKGNK